MTHLRLGKLGRRAGGGFGVVLVFWSAAWKKHSEGCGSCFCLKKQESIFPVGFKGNRSLREKVGVDPGHKQPLGMLKLLCGRSAVLVFAFLGPAPAVRLIAWVY